MSINLREPGNWIVVLSMLLIGINGIIFRGHELDDGLIYARYIQNLISGNGFVYNPGEYVNGLTSPLFAYLSVIPSWLAGDARLGTLLVSVLAAMGTVLVCYQLLGLLVRDRWIAALVALLAAGNGMTYINLGMEASLFTLAVGLCLYLYFSNRFWLLGLCIGLAILTRPEAVFLVPAMALNTLLYRRAWPGWHCYILPTLLVASQLLFNSLYYDALLPSSGLAKISQGAMGHWGNNSFLFSLPGLFLDGFGLSGQMDWWQLPLVPAGLIVVSLFSLLVPRARQYLLVSVAFLLLYTAFFTVLNIPPQWWYGAIYFTLFSTWVILGIHWLCGQCGTAWQRGIFRLSLPGLLAGLLVWQQGINLVLHGNTVREDYKQFGLWIAANTPADASVAVAEIGTIGWYAERRIIDILGLVTPGNADFVAAGDYHSWLTLHPPDYILASEPPRFFESVVTLLQTDRPQALVEVAAFEFPGYKLYRYLPDD